MRTKGGTRRAWLLAAGIGTAAAMTLAPVAVGLSQAGATTPTPVTTTTTVVTNGTWTSPQSTAGTTGTYKVLVECPNHTASGYDYALLATSWAKTHSWIWANVGQAPCAGTGPGPSPANSTVIPTTTFTVPGIPQGATLALAADNRATVSINGTPVATLSRATGTPITNFTTMHTFTVTATVLRQGGNTITIIGHNGATSGYNPAGVIAKLTVSSTSTPVNLCKHTGWRVWTTSPGPFQNQGDCVSYFVKNPNGADPIIPNTAES